MGLPNKRLKLPGGDRLKASSLSRAETDPRNGANLIATPFWGPEFSEFALPPDFGARLRDVSPVYLYHSRDDAELPLEQLEHYRRALPQALVRVLDGRGHEFDQARFPELVADISQLAEVRPV